VGKPSKIPRGAPTFVQKFIAVIANFLAALLRESEATHEKAHNMSTRGCLTKIEKRGRYGLI